jgi:peptidoglycan biosynthesis protein MviN/MurJ (putative lipid II flippase)
VSAVGGWVAPSLVTLLFGGRYAEAGPSASVLFLSAAPFFLNAVMVAVLTIRDPRRLVLWYLSLLVANVGLNLWLIPVLGPVGAAWATFFCELGGAAVATVWTLSETPLGAGRRFTRSLLAALVGAALISLGANGWPGLHWLALGPLSYGLSLWALRAVSWSECREFLRGSAEATWAGRSVRMLYVDACEAPSPVGDRSCHRCGRDRDPGRSFRFGSLPSTTFLRTLERPGRG